MTQRESFDDQPSRHQPTSSENPPQLQASNFWTSAKGVLTILAIAVAATAVVIGLIVSTLDEDNEFGQPAVYTDETPIPRADSAGSPWKAPSPTPPTPSGS